MATTKKVVKKGKPSTTTKKVKTAKAKVSKTPKTTKATKTSKAKIAKTTKTTKAAKTTIRDVFRCVDRV